MFVGKLVEQYKSSLPVVRMGFGKMPMINKYCVFPVWEMLREPLKYSGWSQFAMKSQTFIEVLKRNKHTDNKGQSTPDLGFSRSERQPAYGYSPNVETQKQSAAEHHYDQKLHYRNLKEKIQQKAPLWQPKQYLNKESDLKENKHLKKKVAEVYLEKNAESFPVKKSQPFPKD